MSAATIAHPQSEVLAGSFFDTTNPGFRHSYNRMPFEFAHIFTESHPLFQRSRIRKLLAEGAPTKPWAVYDAGEIRIDQRWDAMPPKTKTVEETFDEIDEGRAWMMLRHVEKDPEYGELLDQCLAEVARLSGHEINSDKKSQEAIIFFTSPNRVTSYHIDRECNFLMQVQGTKTINVFDRTDKEVVPETELEAFWAKDNNAGIYKPQFQDRAFVREMRPGTGVHIPVNCPHWLKNGNNVGISFSISYQFRDRERKNIYQANYHLRRLGLKPTPPGQSVLIDHSKRLAMGAGLAVKRLVKLKLK